ncbi:MAG: hypothetical protein ACYTE5_12615 [Planctomycetota bacterium]
MILSDVLTGYENDFIIYYFFECGNAYDAVEDMWIDHCCYNQGGHND